MDGTEGGDGRGTRVRGQEDKLEMGAGEGGGNGAAERETRWAADSRPRPGQRREQEGFKEVREQTQEVRKPITAGAQGE